MNINAGSGRNRVLTQTENWGTDKELTRNWQEEVTVVQSPGDTEKNLENKIREFF
jgi:hypothetical protein